MVSDMVEHGDETWSGMRWSVVWSGVEHDRGGSVHCKEDREDDDQSRVII